MAELHFPNGTRHLVVCPMCTSKQGFYLHVNAIVPVWDGISMHNGKPQCIGWSASSHNEITCKSCDHTGTVRDFKPA